MLNTAYTIGQTKTAGIDNAKLNKGQIFKVKSYQEFVVK